MALDFLFKLLLKDVSVFFFEMIVAGEKQV